MTLGRKVGDRGNPVPRFLRFCRSRPGGRARRPRYPRHPRYDPICTLIKGSGISGKNERGPCNAQNFEPFSKGFRP